ncbi:MAG: hypothetical protein PW789_09605 [Edaphobacter sp.]|uniref:fibronectin type III domain-containing protein n=1 Tax=Edaphobacter sp. TaxID=1934404 RepID=UPI0023991085|nr:hypothetical protein [Edaphobacter sp.]MDE1176849.1 hypothetical protein [Edaphobacter sp.]
MHLPSHPQARNARRSRTPLAVTATAVAAFTIACASPLPPKPPSLHLVKIPNDVTAERVGNEVHLHWTTPERTTDSLKDPAPLTAELCRETGAPPARIHTLPPCTIVARTPVKPGPSTIADVLPASLTADPVTVLRYRLRILNPNNRTAGDTPVILAPAGAAPTPVAGLHASAARAGAVIEWQPTPTPSIVELVREHTDPKPAAKPKAQGKTPAAPNLNKDEEPVEIRLRSADPRTHPDAADPGGTVDSSATRGASYTYRAQRLRTVLLEGKTFELRSDFSAPVALRNVDTFPPAIPTGLASVPSASNGHPAIDLSWQPVADSDLKGYNVYRSDASGSFNRLNAELLDAPGYSDATVTTGASYRYRVTAVDSSGNESKPSSEIDETAEAPNP